MAGQPDQVKFVEQIATMFTGRFQTGLQVEETPGFARLHDLGMSIREHFFTEAVVEGLGRNYNLVPEAPLRLLTRKTKDNKTRVVGVGLGLVRGVDTNSSVVWVVFDPTFELPLFRGWDQWQGESLGNGKVARDCYVPFETMQQLPAQLALVYEGLYKI